MLRANSQQFSSINTQQRYNYEHKKQYLSAIDRFIPSYLRQNLIIIEQDLVKDNICQEDHSCNNNYIKMIKSELIEDESPSTI